MSALGYLIGLILLGILAVLQSCNPKTLTPDEFGTEIAICHQKGKGVNIDFNEDNPAKVYSVTCSDENINNETGY